MNLLQDIVAAFTTNEESKFQLYRKNLSRSCTESTCPENNCSSGSFLSADRQHTSHRKEVPQRHCSLRSFLLQRFTIVAGAWIMIVSRCSRVAAWSTTTITTPTLAPPRRTLGSSTPSSRQQQALFRTLCQPGTLPSWSYNCMESPTRIRMCTDSRELRFLSGASSVLSSITTTTSTSYRCNTDDQQEQQSQSGGLWQDALSQTYAQVFQFAASTPLLASNNENESFLSSVSAMVLGARNSNVMMTGAAFASSKTMQQTAIRGNVATLNHNNAFYFTSRNFATRQGLGSRGGPTTLDKPATTATLSKTKTTIKTTSLSARPITTQRQPQTGYGDSIRLTDEERELFDLLRRVRVETGLDTTLRVAGGWVRDKLLATPEFQAYHRVFDVGQSARYSKKRNTSRLTSKFRTSATQTSSMGRQGTKVLVSHNYENQPVDIDIALDDMLGREFADHLNEYLTSHGMDEVTVGMVLKNPEKSKHLETATMKVASFWIDFVNLRAEEYTQDSRIPDLMRIGSAEEDAFRRDLTINALFYNINTGQVEDWTGRGFQDLRKGVIATPLPPLTTLLDDPLRVLRSIRFAARLRFTMDEELIEAAKTSSVGQALTNKVSRERVGGELDLMLRSPDPVGAIRLLINLKLVECVFPVESHFRELVQQQLEKSGAFVASIPQDKTQQAVSHLVQSVFDRGVYLLTTAHDHLADCRWSPPVWCLKNPHQPSTLGYGATEMRLVDDEEARRLLWYAAFLKPLYDDFKIQQTQAQAIPKRQSGAKKANRCIVSKMLVDELKRPGRDADAVQRIMRGADDFTNLIKSGSAVSATVILLSSVQVAHTTLGSSDDLCDVESQQDCNLQHQVCFMNGRRVDSTTEDDPVWLHAMEFRLEATKIMRRIGSLWRAALFLSIAEELVESELYDDMEYTIEGDVFDDSQEQLRQGVMERYDALATALQQVGVIGIWDEKPLLDGDAVKRILPRLPKGPPFRQAMDEQMDWITMHPGGGKVALEMYLRQAFPDYVSDSEAVTQRPSIRPPTDEDGSWL